MFLVFFSLMKDDEDMFEVLLFIIRVIVRLMPLLVLYIALYRDPSHQKLNKSGFREKDAAAGNVRFHYAESSGADKPPLVLLHAQLLDWFSYHRVLIRLSEKYHVYAVDYPGHGKTVCPDDYEMSAKNIGASLAEFIREIVGQPVFISGNSSGGLLALWLAANRPHLIRAAVLEDPPLLSSEYPAIKRTVAYRTFSSGASAVQEDTDGDYLMYWIRHSPAFFRNHLFPGAASLLRFLIFLTRMLKKNQPVEIPFLPPLFREMLRGIDMYDPHFGKAFYEGTWNEGFDHTAALDSVMCPVLLITADTSFLEDGTLNGAMSEETAQFAFSRLRNGSRTKINAKHVTHLEAPDAYLEAVLPFLKQVSL